MMRRRTILGASALAAGLLAALALPTPASGQGKSCAECCKLPCIEAQLWQARYMRGFYRNLSRTRGLTQERYLERENDAAHLSSIVRHLYLGENPACEWQLPDPRKENMSTVRGLFFNTGFGLADNDGYYSWNLTLAVSDETCSLTHPRGAQVLPELTPCDGIGRSTVAHEQKHVVDCCRHRGGRLVPSSVEGLQSCELGPKARSGALTPQQGALREVAGYDAEIAELEKLRKQAAEPCTKKSCETNQLRFDIAARNFGTDIRHLLGLDKKPPSSSPLSRSRRGR